MSLVTRAITSRGTIEDRLRRSLNLVGEVGATFSPAATPIIIAADATIPGCSTDRGRRFSASCSAIVPTNPGTAGIEARRDLVITGLRIKGSGAIATVLTTRIVAAGTAADFAMTAAGVGLANFGSAWVERPASNNDFPPVFAGYNAATFATGRTASVGAPAGVWEDLLTKPFFLRGPDAASSTGDRITFTVSAAVANSYLLVEGYTF
jgi:energy-converting hydrogenase Eha subunit A